MNILLCVDRDAMLDDLLVAFRWSVRVSCADRVSVVHVVPKVAFLKMIGRVDPTVGELVAALPRQAKELLSEAVDFLRQQGMRAQPLLRHGDPPSEILRAARDEEVDLIVVGVLGHRDKENLLLGSVSHRVERNAHCDVLIVRGTGRVAPTRFVAIVAVDGSSGSLSALRSFVAKMQTVLADIHLLHVAQPSSKSPEKVIEVANAILEQEGLECTSEIRHGRPAAEILACAKERDAYIIAMGAHGHDATSSAFMGSVSARVVRHAPCAVLCARTTQ